jgi:predicted outer membrane repeat protein
MKSKLLSITSLLCLSPAALASTWYVNGQNGSDSNDCKTTLTACQTITRAISMAASGDAIQIAAAIYTENVNIPFNLRLTGAAPATTIIDGGYYTHAVSILNTALNVTLSKLTIRNGSAAGGGGIINWGTLTISNSTISGNFASSSYSATGGGIYNSGTLTINNSTLSKNSGSTNFVYGGGIYNSGTLAINNSTLYGNSAADFNGGGGGGIYNQGTAKISNTTFSGNSSPVGGAIYNGGTITFQNSIIANSTSGGNCYGTVTSSGYNLSSDGTCNFSSTGDRNNTNPKLGALRNNGGLTLTIALPTGSPAVDAGNPTGCTDNLGRLLKTDQRGQPRPDKEDTGGCDMGAYERSSD